MLFTASLSASPALPFPTLPYPTAPLPLPCAARPAPSSQVEPPPLTTLSASFPYSLPLATPLAGAKLLLRPHLSYIPRHHSRSSSSHHRVSHAGSHSEQEYPGAQLHVVRSIAALSTPPRQRIFPTPTLDLGAVLARCSRNVFFPCVVHRVVQDVSVLRPTPARSVGEDRRGCLHTFDAVTHCASKRRPSGISTLS